MSVEFKSKKAILSLISLINRYTGKESTNLTDAVNELKEKNETGRNKIKGLCDGTVEALTAEDLQGITKIIPYLFMNNTALKYVELPENVTVLGDNCFNGCTELDMPFLPEGVERLGFNNFNQCKKLSVRKLPDALNYIGSNAFTNCVSLRISEIPEGVTYIGRMAFASCTSLETVTFKGTPASIDRGTFAGCTSLREINVPWAEGAVGDAPWGSSAVINYNYTE